MSLHEVRVRLGFLLADEQVRGAIILLAITLEASLDSFLTGYFAHTAKQDEFERTVLGRLTVSQKIDIFKSAEFPKSLRSFPQLVAIYQGVNRLRNHCAHAHWDDGPKIVKLADNEFIREFVSSTSDPVTTTTTRVRRLLASLSRSRIYKLRELEFTDDDIPF